MRPILPIDKFACQALPAREPRAVTFLGGHDLQAIGARGEHPPGRSTLTRSLGIFLSSAYGRILKTVLSRRRKKAKKSSNCFHGTYFLLSSRIP
jgi:hypothetical protein